MAERRYRTTSHKEKKKAAAAYFGSVAASAAAVAGANKISKNTSKTSKLKRKGAKRKQQKREAQQRDIKQTKTKIAKMEKERLERIPDRHLDKNGRKDKKSQIQAQKKIISKNSTSKVRKYLKKVFKAGKALSPLGVVATVMSPTKMGDGTLRKKKQ